MNKDFSILLLILKTQNFNLWLVGRHFKIILLETNSIFDLIVLMVFKSVEITGSCWDVLKTTNDFFVSVWEGVTNPLWWDYCFE